MDALGGSSWWSTHPFNQFRQRGTKHRGERNNKCNDSSSDSAAQSTASHRFPLKQAVIAESLALAGDTIARLRHRWTSKPDSQLCLFYFR
ncbi:hypothetical protein SOVF_080220 [Spinacia oleracea]|nr:hypothetical protein SOVF_080220 [Spinacia oleracea]